MRTFRLIVALVGGAALVTFAVQNTTPRLALVFLGGRTVALPLAVWLVGAIALGALTALALVSLAAVEPGPASRRRWRVNPEGPDPARRRPRSEPREPRRAAPPPPPYAGTRPPGPDRSGDDWGAWEQRTAANQWEDWGQMREPVGPDGRPLSQRQRRQQEQADTSFQDIAEGWDSRVERQPYVAQGGSEVEDALDDISSGWGDWGDRPPGLVDEPPPAATAYSYRYGEDTETRKDPVHAPVDDWVDGDEGDASEESGEVYDADYRVIIPPHRLSKEGAEETN
jgi:hypothetical protein